MTDYHGIRTMPGTTGRNGMPEAGGYVYNGAGRDILPPSEITRRTRERVRRRRRADGRCPDCGYLPATRSHEIACGGGQ